MYFYSPPIDSINMDYGRKSKYRTEEMILNLISKGNEFAPILGPILEYSNNYLC